MLCLYCVFVYSLTLLRLSFIACLDYLGNLRYIVVKVACSENDEYVKVTAFNEVEHFVLAYDAFLNTWLEVVVYQL